MPTKKHKRKRATDHYLDACELAKSLDEPAMQGNLEKSIATVYKNWGL